MKFGGGCWFWLEGVWLRLESERCFVVVGICSYGVVEFEVGFWYVEWVVNCGVGEVVRIYWVDVDFEIFEFEYYVCFVLFVFEV